MVHPTIKNKPVPFQPEFSDNWKEVVGPLEELKNHVGNGGAFIGARMLSGHRSSSAFDFADLAVVDIDHGLTIEQFKEHPWQPPPAGGTRRQATGQRRSLPRGLPTATQDQQSCGLQGCRDTLDQVPEGDKSCKDACRLFYGNDKAEHFVWNPDVTLPESILDDAEDEARNQRKREAVRTDSYDEITLEQAIFV